MSAVRHAPLDLRTAEDMLAFVDGCEDRETWVAVGMALKSEFGDLAFDAWDRWSQNAANYNIKACTASWRGFKARNGGYTVGTLIKLAKDGGYRFAAGDVPQVENAELARRRAERAARTERELATRQAQAVAAMQTAKADWHSAMREGSSAYAARKGIDAPESCRFIPSGQGGGLVIPMVRYDLNRTVALKGLQVIRDDGSKKFTFGMEKPGTACRLGLPVVGAPVFVCEGYATGMTIRMALGRRCPVFVAFDAYNLPVVTEAVALALPGSPIVICADDDWKTAIKGISNNVGRIQAQVAMENAMDTGTRLVVRTFPVFRKETVRGDKDSDFNDLHRLEGLGEVADQLQLCLDSIEELKKYG